jgi:hypothetical protein
MTRQGKLISPAGNGNRAGREEEGRHPILGRMIGFHLDAKMATQVVQRRRYMKPGVLGR